MKLPQSFIDEVLSRIDLVEIIEKRVSLQRTGRANYTGLCPFHAENTPSFSVSQLKQFYYCFGCKASGNAIRFLMAYDKLSFIEAIEMLAEKAGLSLPQRDCLKEEESTLSLSLLEKAASFFQEQLACSPVAKQYLTDRGLSAEIIDKFRIGFAPSSGENLLNKLGDSLRAKQQLLTIGMLAERKNQLLFRNRIIFPIRNKRGQIIAFGGRSLGNQMPKYLNSPETAYFHKSRELYGLHEALQANKQTKQFIIVEGYLDVIALHQHGIREAVATLGTAISLQHLQLLLRYAESLCFCFDGDQAGKKAAWRVVEIALPLMNTGVDLSFLVLPEGEDPDSYIRKVGSQQFRQKRAESIPLSDFFFNTLNVTIEINSLAGKTRFVHLVDKYLRKLPKGIFQELMYEKLAEIIGMNLSKVHDILQPPLSKVTAKQPITTQSRKLIQPLRLSLSLLLQNPKLLFDLRIPDYFYSLELDGMALLYKIIKIIQQNPHLTTGSLLEYVEEDSEKSLFQELAMVDLLIPDAIWLSELQGAVIRLCEIDLEQRIHLLMAKGSREGLNLEEKRSLQKLLVSQKSSSSTL
jgi:DNA primase